MLGELRLIVGTQSGLRWMRLTSRACAHETLRAFHMFVCLSVKELKQPVGCGWDI